VTNVNKRIVIYIIVGLVAVLIIGAMITMNSGGSEGSLLAATGESITELLSLGQRYLLELNYEAAIVAFTRVIEIDPMNVDALVGRGQARVLWQEELDLARADFERALEIDERSVGAYLGLVDIYIRLGDFERALELARLGYEMTGDAALREMVEALEGGTVRDSEGRVRRERYYNEDGFTFSLVRSYTQGRLVSITTFNPAGDIISHGDINYDEQGNRLQNFSPTVMASDSDLLGVLNRTEYTRDSEGRVIRRDSFRPDGALGSFHLYERGADGILTRRTFHQSDGRMTSESLHDSQGRTVRRNSFGHDGQLRSYELWEHDAEGRLARISTYNADGTLERYSIWEYDAEGREIRRSSFDADGTPRSFTVTEYNDDGSIRSRTEYRADGTISYRQTSGFESEPD